MYLSLLKRIKKKVWAIIVKKFHSKIYYPLIYKSYWKAQFIPSSLNLDTTQYMSAEPNPGAGIGHQMANWNAGYWFAKQFDLQFAHMPFSTKEWEDFLGFGFDEASVSDLIKKKGYKKIKIPLFDEKNNDEVSRTKKIIESFKGSKVIFICELDQAYQAQYGIKKYIQNKFFNSAIRKNDKKIYKPSSFNIALHIRRGDIVQKNLKNPNLTMRWLNNDYFFNVIESILKFLKTKNEIHIYLFSQGKINDFTEFKKFDNIHFCLDMSAQDSFLHMVYADLLITSKSSFSYKPALLNKGIKVVPKNFWHSYPKSKNWFLADNFGNIINKP